MKNTLLDKVVGFGTCTTASVACDDVLWPVVVVWLGPIKGGLGMTLFALVLNLIFIWAYDRLKRDVFGFEKIREIQEAQVKGFWMKVVTKAIKVGRVPAFFVLSFYDPFLAVIYVRKGIGGYRMTLRDWKFFGLAMVIGCVGWTVFWAEIIWLVKVFCMFLF